jgi:Spy/CpxP family protein refolding chaperone
MYPGFLHWWKEAQRHGGGGCCDARAGCGPGGAGGGGRHRATQRGDGHDSHDSHEAWAAGEDGGGSFGVRRPLRFMAWKLELNDAQVEQLASILADLKTERAQAAVDHRRSVGLFADALDGDAFDVDKATRGAESRVQTAEKLKAAVLTALQRTHALLDPEQRKALAYLLRSGQLTI